MTLQADRDLLNQILIALQATLGDDLLAVVLYGSRAKGEAHVQSDWDLLLIAEKLPEKPLARHFFLKRALPAACRGAVSLVAKTPVEFESRVPPLFLDIALDGIILYDPKGYAAARLEKLKNLIATSGLHRLRSKDGDVWKFDKPHSEPWSLSWE